MGGVNKSGNQNHDAATIAAEGVRQEVQRTAIKDPARRH